MERNITLVIVLPVLWLTSCGMALSVLPPLDFPPGDMQTLTIVNDTRRALVVFDCDDPTCVRGINDQEITVGGRDYRNADSYTPQPVGIADPVTHRLVGCLQDLPHSDHMSDNPPPRRHRQDEQRRSLSRHD
jgi:hypothetical protein